MSLTDQIDAMLALCANTKPALKMPMSLRSAKERIAVDKFHVAAASRTGWEATLRALKVAVEFIDDSIACNAPVTGKDPWVETAREVLAKIAKELEATQ